MHSPNQSAFDSRSFRLRWRVDSIPPLLSLRWATPARWADGVARVQPLLRQFRADLGLGPGEETTSAPPGDSFGAQFEAVLRARPRVFSFTIGMPSPEHLRALRARSILLIGTATNLAEVEALDELGVDAICAQGAEAGGHRGTFLESFEDAMVGTMALVPLAVRRVRRPVIAAGGIMDGRGISAALGLGAQAVQLGTAFLACPEAVTSPAHREALFSAAVRHTVVTRAFSGRPARGIRNRFSEAFEGVQVPSLPLQHRLTREIRSVAGAQGQDGHHAALGGAGRAAHPSDARRRAGAYARERSKAAELSSFSRNGWWVTSDGPTISSPASAEVSSEFLDRVVF